MSNFGIAPTSMEDFIRSKKLQGYDYDGSAEILKVFDRFLVHKSFRSQRISREILEDYIAESRQAGLHANALYQRVLTRKSHREKTLGVANS